MILRNIEQYLVKDRENQSAYLNLAGSYWWYWYGSEYETFKAPFFDRTRERKGGLAG